MLSLIFTSVVLHLQSDRFCGWKKAGMSLGLHVLSLLGNYFPYTLGLDFSSRLDASVLPLVMYCFNI